MRDIYWFIKQAEKAHKMEKGPCFSHMAASQKQRKIIMKAFYTRKLNCASKNLTVKE